VVRQQERRFKYRMALNCGVDSAEQNFLEMRHTLIYKNLVQQRKKEF